MAFKSIPSAVRTQVTGAGLLKQPHCPSSLGTCNLYLNWRYIAPDCLNLLYERTFLPDHQQAHSREFCASRLCHKPFNALAQLLRRSHGFSSGFPLLGKPFGAGKTVRSHKTAGSGKKVPASLPRKGRAAGFSFLSQSSSREFRAAYDKPPSPLEPQPSHSLAKQHEND